MIEAINEKAFELLFSDTEALVAALLLDESGILKQGKKSVGVARQYCGSAGKSRQLSGWEFFLGYANGYRATLIDKRLYLPKVWTQDSERCEEAGIPKEYREFKTKAQLGYEMILEAQKKRASFRIYFDGCFLWSATQAPQ